MTNLPIQRRPTGRLLSSLLAAALAVAWLFAGSLAAQNDLEKPPPIPPEDSADVPIPPKIQGEQIEHTLTSREEEDRIIE